MNYKSKAQIIRKTRTSKNQVFLTNRGRNLAFPEWILETTLIHSVTFELSWSALHYYCVWKPLSDMLYILCLVKYFSVFIITQTVAYHLKCFHFAYKSTTDVQCSVQSLQSGADKLGCKCFSWNGSTRKLLILGAYLEMILEILTGKY